MGEMGEMEGIGRDRTDIWGNRPEVVTGAGRESSDTTAFRVVRESQGS